MKAQGSVLIAIVILLAVAGIYGYFFYNQPQVYLNITKNTTVSATPPANGKTQENNAVILNVPAVDNEGNGVVTTVRVEAKPGSGRTLVDINSILFFVDTQNAGDILSNSLLKTRVATSILKGNAS